MRLLIHEKDNSGSTELTIFLHDSIHKMTLAPGSNNHSLIWCFINNYASLSLHWLHSPLKDKERDLPGIKFHVSTKNPKQYSKKDIATACFAGGAEKRLRDGRLDYYIDISVEGANSNQFSRERDDLYKCKYSTLYLDRLDYWRSGQVSSCRRKKGSPHWELTITCCTYRIIYQFNYPIWHIMVVIVFASVNLSVPSTALE